MATIRKRNNTYQIRVSVGYNISGNQIIKTKTWKPSEGMTAKQIEKELHRQTVLFEEQCQTGQFMDGNITLSAFADMWLKDYAQLHLKAKTLYYYNEKLKRIIPSLGHIKLNKLQPHHLIEFYKSLSEEGTRMDIKCIPNPNFTDIMRSAGYTQQTLSIASEVSRYTVQQCSAGRNITLKNAEKINKIIQVKNLFTAIDKNKTLSDKTIAGHHRVLSSMLTTAVQWQIILSNPCNRVKPPKVARKEAQVLDETQAAELIECLQHEPIKYRTAVMTLLYTGLRRGELCGLEWSDIDFEHGLLNVNKSVLYLPELGVYEDTTKNRSSERRINIPYDLIMLLKEYQIEQKKQQLLLGDLWKPTNKVFTAEYGGVIHPDTLSGWFSNFIKRHNLPDVHLHTLRHTSATLLIAGGVDVVTVSKRLGHADKTTTLNIYSHAIRSADEAAAEKLSNILNPKYKAN